MAEAPAMRGFRALLATLVSVLAALYAAVGLARHATYRSTGFDLGLFDQVVWHLGNLEEPGSSLKGLESIFGDHFSPILLALAPAGALDSGPTPLIVAQAALVALSVLPVVLFARPRLGERGALLLGVGYGLFCGVQSAVAFDFHEVAFAPLLIASAILLADHGRWRASLACVLALLLVKEDMSFLVIAFGVWFALQRRRREALVCVAGGAFWYAAVTDHVIPHFADGRRFSYWSYGQIGTGPGDAVLQTILHPFHTLRVFLSPRQKVQTMAALFGAFAFLPLASIELVLAAPLLAERMFSSNAKYWSLQDHYSLVVAPVLAIGAARAMPAVIAWLHARRPRTRDWRLQSRLCVLIAVVGVASCAHFSLGDLAKAGAWRTPADRAGAEQVLSAIPEGASVAASNQLVPHLSQRDRIVLFGPRVPTERFVVVHSGTDPSSLFPFDSEAAQQRVVRRLGASYRLVRSSGAVRLWRRR